MTVVGPVPTDKENSNRAAHQAGHARLYHYEKFDVRWLTTTLRDQKIYCSDPARLNDPWDCKPTYDPASVTNPKDIEDFILWLRSIPKERLQPQREAAFEDRLRTDTAYRNQIVEGFSTRNRSMIERRRIYCLTPNPYSTLLWSHYADNHRGICLEFHLGNDVFLNSWEMKYSSMYPSWPPHRMREFALDMLLTKSDEWAYEKEFRVIGSPDRPDGHPLKLDGDFLKLPPRSLVGILVGCKGDYTEVAKIVEEHAPSLPVKRIVQIPNHYRLTIAGEAEAVLA
jgi:hypothetical protein